jgi:hypothetical protein
MPKELRSNKQALAYLHALGEKGVKAQFEVMISKAFKTSTLQKWRANLRRIRNFARDDGFPVLCEKAILRFFVAFSDRDGATLRGYHSALRFWAKLRHPWIPAQLQTALFSPAWSLFSKALSNIINSAKKPRGNLSAKQIEEVSHFVEESYKAAPLLVALLKALLRFQSVGGWRIASILATGEGDVFRGRPPEDFILLRIPKQRRQVVVRQRLTDELAERHKELVASCRSIGLVKEFPFQTPEANGAIRKYSCLIQSAARYYQSKGSEEQKLRWSEAISWVGHSVRHFAASELAKKAETPKDLSEIISDQWLGTLRWFHHYTKDNQDRRLATTKKQNFGLDAELQAFVQGVDEASFESSVAAVALAGASSVSVDPLISGDGGPHRPQSVHSPTDLDPWSFMSNGDCYM